MPFHNGGTVDVQAGTLGLDAGGTLQFDSGSYLQSQPGTTLRLSALHVGGTSTNAAEFAPKGRVLFSGSGTRQVEVMSRDLGPVAAGYTNNFAYGTLELTSSATVTLANNSDNSPGNEALYVWKT